MTGPLEGLRAIELAGIGPGPFAAMMLSDMGADVLIVDRPPTRNELNEQPDRDPLRRGRRSMVVDLKNPRGPGLVLRLIESADVLIEGYRPGVAERLGIGPEVCLERNPKLVYARVTGWGQTGPLSHGPGHDINYLAVAGALHPIGRAGQPPTPPLNLVGDFGGGGMLLAFGIICAIYEAQRSGTGQVVDAAMVDGAALLTAATHGMRAMGIWRDVRGTNLVDSGAPFYDVYETADGEWISVGALETRFFIELVRLLGLEAEFPPGDRLDQARWPALKTRLTEVFRTRTRAEWCQHFDGTDTCFAPVMSLGEAPDHPHNLARNSFIDLEGVKQPAPAPRFSRSSTPKPMPPPLPGQQTDEALVLWGFAPAEVEELRAVRAIG